MSTRGYAAHCCNPVESTTSHGGHRIGCIRGRSARIRALAPVAASTQLREPESVRLQEADSRDDRPYVPPKQVPLASVSPAPLANRPKPREQMPDPSSTSAPQPQLRWTTRTSVRGAPLPSIRLAWPFAPPCKDCLEHCGASLSITFENCPWGRLTPIRPNSLQLGVPFVRFLGRSWAPPSQWHLAALSARQGTLAAG